MNIDQFIAGLQATESGGSYTAVGPSVNGNRAYGRYQVMDFNIPTWTAKYFGKSLTPQQFLANHAAQDAVVKGVIQSYYDRYGSWESAAAMWFSGQPNANSQKSDGSLTVQQYVQRVMSNAGRSSSTTSSSGGTVAAKDTINSSDLAAQYSFTAGLLAAYPELKRLFDKAIDKGWDQATFQAKLQDTQFWKTHSQSERDYIELGYTDKATADQKYQQASLHARQLGEQLGITASKTQKQLATAAYNIVAKGWTDEQVRNYLGAYVYFDTSHGFQPGGEGQNVSDQIVQYSYQMGVKNAGHWYGDWARKIIRGLATVDDAKSAIQRQAIAMYPQYTKQLQSGSTVQDLAQPYIQSMQNILELNPGSITMFDNTIKKAMGFKDSQGKAASMPIWQFENQLREDPRWKQTKNAQDSLMSVAHGVLQDFGLRT